MVQCFYLHFERQCSGVNAHDQRELKLLKSIPDCESTIHSHNSTAIAGSIAGDSVSNGLIYQESVMNKDNGTMVVTDCVNCLQQVWHFLINYILAGLYKKKALRSFPYQSAQLTSV